MLAPSENLTRLRMTRNWLADKNNWTPGTAENHRGQRCAAGAYTFMATGNVNGNPSIIPESLLNAAVTLMKRYTGSSCHPGYVGIGAIIHINDSIGYAAVMEMFDLAIKIEMGQEPDHTMNTVREPYAGLKTVAIA